MRDSRYWHNVAVRSAAAVAEGWSTYESVYRPCEWSAEALTDVRSRRLTAALAAARSTRQFREAISDDHQPFESLKRLPVLEKKVLAKDPGALRTDRYAARDVIRTRTSGTTGDPVVIEHDDRRLTEAFASHLRMLAAYDLAPPQRSLRFTADPRHPVIDFDYQALAGLDMSLRINASKLTDDNARHVFALCHEFKPSIITGQPLEVLLGCTKTAQLGALLPPVSMVQTHGDAVSRVTRSAIKEVVGARHCDIYGLQETGKVAWACPDFPLHYHVDEEKVICEVDDAGLLLLTSLVNDAMALLRYRPGDGCMSAPAICPCGRAIRVISGLQGRQRGFIIDRDAQPIAIKPVRLYLESLDYKHWQFIQEVPGEAILLICDRLSPEDLIRITRRVEDIGNLAVVRIREAALSDLMTPAGKAPQFRLLMDQRSLAASLTSMTPQGSDDDH
jgi:phenylacetate-CoA ligase